MLFSLLLAVNVALAGSTNGENHCKKSDLSMNEMLQCNVAQYNAAEKKMNALVARLRSENSADKQYVQLLGKSQQAWLQSRKANVELIFRRSRFRGMGMMQNTLKYEYLLKVTRERIQFLSGQK